MITFPTILGPDGRSIVTQSLTHPVVYLDTWALRLFAEDEPALGYRFRTALKRTNGALMISHMSIGEFTSFDDPRHAWHAGDFVNSIIPNLYFSRFDPFAVIEDEYRILVGQRDASPAGDEHLLGLYAEDRARRGHESVREWFLSMHADRINNAAIISEMAQRFLGGIAELRGRIASEPDFAKLARENVKVSTLPRATQALLRALIYRLDPMMKLDETDALDISHCIVPAAYADFVLLDRRWYVRLEDTREYLRSVGIETRIAEQYTKRDNGALQFLERLETWPLKERPAA